jgi:glycosyltransferase involved in cell wall biosynthesis
MFLVVKKEIKMRILHMINHCSKANGHVNVSVDMACTQARNGHFVGYSCSYGDYIPLLKTFGVTVYHVDQPHRGIQNFLRSQRQLLKAIRDFQPDVIHVHMAAQNVLVQPYRFLGYKTVTTVHNEFDRSVWIMGLASRIVTVSQAGRRAMVRRGFNKKKVRTVLNGTVGTPRLPPEFEVADVKSPAIITVCGMHHRKGVSDLLKAFQIVLSQFPSASLYLVGSGPSLAEYKSLSNQLGISSSTHFLGHRDDPREYLHASDIFVLASHADPGPLVIAEARNAGCAIVGTDVDGIPEMLDCGTAGILVQPKRPDLMAQAINSLLSNPLTLKKYTRMSQQNADHFTVGRVCREMDEIYAELISGRRRRIAHAARPSGAD